MVQMNYKIIEVRGYYRNVMLNNQKVKKWVKPYIRKIKLKEIRGQKSLNEYETNNG